MMGSNMEQTSQEPPPRQTISTREIQQSYLESFGDRDWDKYGPSDIYLIKQKILFALFGSPTIESDLIHVHTNSDFGYDPKNVEEMKPIYEKIQNFKIYSPDRESIYLSVLFICLVPEDASDQIDTFYEENLFDLDKISVYPIFKVRKCIKPAVSDGTFGCCFIVDHIGRIYQSFENYLNENTLPEGIIIAPRNGRYSGTIIQENIFVQLVVKKSPASMPLATAKKIGEKASIATAVGVVGVMAFGAFAPVAAGVVLAVEVASVATGLFGATVSTGHLMDRRAHGQSVSVTDAEARGSWINLAASGFAMSFGATSKYIQAAATQGATVGMAIRVAHNVSFAAITLTSFAGMVGGFYHFTVTYQTTGQHPTNLELFQLASSVLFFTNAMMSNQIASTIIEETQTSQIANYRNTLSRRNRRAYDKVVAETRRVNGRTAGNTEIIKTNLKITSNDQFYQNIMKFNKLLNKHNVKISLKDGNALLNNQHVIEPRDFMKLSFDQRAEFLGSLDQNRILARNYSTLPPNQANHNLAVIPIISSESTRLEINFPNLTVTDEHIPQYIEYLLGSFGRDSTVPFSFIKIMKFIESNIDLNMKEQLAFLGVNDTDLMFRLFRFSFHFVKDLTTGENSIADTLKLFMINDEVSEVMGNIVLNSFKSELLEEFKKFIKTSTRCSVCDGITFS